MRVISAGQGTQKVAKPQRMYPKIAEGYLH